MSVPVIQQVGDQAGTKPRDKLLGSSVFSPPQHIRETIMSEDEDGLGTTCVPKLVTIICGTGSESVSDKRKR